MANRGAINDTNIPIIGKENLVRREATFGTHSLAQSICRAIGDRNSVLVAKHGLAAVGHNLRKASSAAEFEEYVSKVYLISRSVGSPVDLGIEEIQEVIRRPVGYGEQPGKTG